MLSVQRLQEIEGVNTVETIVLKITQFGDPTTLIKVGGIFLLLLIIYLETGFFVGLVLPGGDYLVFTAGVLCGTHYLDISLVSLVSFMILAAIAGDYTGYLKGKWLGPKLFSKTDARFFKKTYLEKTGRFYERYGIWAFVTGRFMPVIRTLIPMLAGASGVSIKKFSALNIIGAVLWIAILTPLGYFVGKKYPQIINYSVWLLLGFILIASIPALKVIGIQFKKKN